MTANPWMKFYPRDWRGDQALRAVSVAARGFWMECLCIMHEAKPYGHLLLNGEPVEGDTLARMTGTSVDEAAALLAELRKAGVLSVTGRGVVFSRRMTKDHARAQKGRNAVKLRYAQASDDVEQSEAPSRLPSRVPITQKPEARYQKPEQEARAREDLSSEINQLNRILGFDESDWQNHAKNIRILADLKASGCDFERHIRPAAERAGRGGTKRSLAYIRPKAEELRDAEGLVKSMPTPFVPTDERGWHDRMRGWQDAGRWSPKWGPSPDAPGCKCPPEIIAKYAKKDAA